VCASGFEGKLYFFDVKTGRTLPSIHAHDLSVHRIAAHPKEGGLFAAASLDGSVSIFTKDGVRLFIMTQDPCSGVAFDLFRPDRIAISCKSGRIYLWDWRLSAGVGHRSQQQSPKSARLGARE
jgi:WD40 repeat protein